MRREMQFKSEGDTCRGWLYTPEGKGPFPAVVEALGGGYVKEFPIAVSHAEAFARAGMATLLFDYRYFGESDGHPRQLLSPLAQIEDCRNALSFAQTLPEIDPGRLGIWGVSIGGGHALVLPAIDARVRASVSVVPMVDGWPTQKLIHGEQNFKKLLEYLAEDRKRRFQDPRKRMKILQSSLTPDKEQTAWPFADVYEVFHDYQKTMAPTFQHWWQAESVELIMNFSVWPFLPRILNTPVAMIVAEGDMHNPWHLSVNAFNQIPSQRKELFMTPPGATHMSVYANPSHTKIAQDFATTFLSKYLAKRP